MRISVRPVRSTAPAFATLAAPAAGALLLAAGDARAAGGGLELMPDPPLLLLLLVLFALLVLPVNALLFRPIFRVLDARAEKIDGTRRRADRLAAETEQVLSRYETAVRAAREEAEADRKRSLTEARQHGSEKTASARDEAEREIDRAREAVAGELESARTSLRAEAEQLAREAAARVLGRGLQ